ncbi:hypothetical protein FUAX_05730 [Fulvitalea axinellae]|uniref:Transposase IS30-like HTH domain-containing protein n=1 Tax=Fulvitalea axinellae TaxID=1182444 RepID=A0AAU9D5R6_9BACT|nr:hypothetical protein FUAX_05730 [Fulvitalea axinellae]
MATPYRYIAPYRHLEPAERLMIERMWGHGLSVRFIAKAINRAPSTVSRELERNRFGQYYSGTMAQQLAEARKTWGATANIRYRAYGLRKRRYTHRISHNMICWTSDLNHYLRLGINTRQRRLLGSFFKKPSLFKAENKPFGFRRALLLYKTIQLQARLNKDTLHHQDSITKHDYSPNIPPPNKTTIALFALVDHPVFSNQAA